LNSGPLPHAGRDFKIKERQKRGTVEMSLFDNRLFDRIHTLRFPIGKKGNKIEIPRLFYKRNLLKYLIQGFFATDGSIVLTKNPNKYYSRLEIHSISKNALFQVYNYLRNLGLSVHFYKCKRKKETIKWNRQTQYRIQINGRENLILFHNLIGFVNPKHENKYIKFLKYFDEYDNSTKGISSKKQKQIGQKINDLYYKSGSGED
tara:strand:- start:10703 stop:11314 length:612 start_codon:yes stop_codon:yes gene_type:complete